MGKRHPCNSSGGAGRLRGRGTGVAGRPDFPGEIHPPKLAGISKFRNVRKLFTHELENFEFTLKFLIRGNLGIRV